MDGRPQRILGGQALTPCCSAIGPLPQSIPGGGKCEIPVSYRPGYSQGKSRVEFMVSTDRGVVTYSVSANTTPAFEVEFADPNGSEVAAGRDAAWSLIVTCRRSGADGLDLPSVVAIDPPSTARFVGLPSEIKRTDGVIETRREIAVTHPASHEPGAKTVDLRIVWEKQGRSERQSIQWMVKPALKASPPAIVLDRGSHDVIAREVLVESTGTEFRVLGVSGKAVAPGFVPPESRGVAHRIAIPIDAQSTGISDVRIETDHPDQPTLKVSLLIPSPIESSNEKESP